MDVLGFVVAQLAALALACWFSPRMLLWAAMRLRARAGALTAYRACYRARMREPEEEPAEGRRRIKVV